MILHLRYSPGGFLFRDAECLTSELGRRGLLPEHTEEGNRKRAWKSGRARGLRRLQDRGGKLQNTADGGREHSEIVYENT